MLIGIVSGFIGCIIFFIGLAAIVFISLSKVDIEYYG